MPRHANRRFPIRQVALAAALTASLSTAQALPVSWITAGSSFWDLAANWSGGVLPGAADDVSLTLAGTRTVTYRQNVTTINSLSIGTGNTLLVNGGTLNAGSLLSNTGAISVTNGNLNTSGGNSSAMSLTGGALGLTGTLTATGTITMGAGTINGGTVQQVGVNRLVLTNSTGTLNGVTVRGDMNIGDAVNTSGRVRIGSNGLVVLTEAGAAPGVVNVGTLAGVSSAVLGFTGTQSFDNATINLGSTTQGGIVSLDSGGTFTLGAAATIQGSGIFGQAQFVGGTNNIINNGTVSANVATRTLTVNNSGTLTNNGVLEARNGGTLTFGSTNVWTNAGIVRVADATSTVNLGGTFTNTATGSFSNIAGGTLNLTGTLNNAAATLTFSPTTGSMRLVGGTISGGTVQFSGSNRLVPTSSNSTLDGVTLRGDLVIGDAVNAAARVRIGSNGVTVLSETGAAPGTIVVGAATGATSTILGFTGTQTFNNATISLGSATQTGIISLDSGGTFTLGANGVIQGSGTMGQAQFVGGTNNIVNNGTLSANLAGRTLTLNNSGTLTNNGVMEARNGGILSLGVSGGWTNAGTIRVADASSTINLGGTFSNGALGSFVNTAGGNLNLTGTLNNSAATLAFSPATGSMRLFGGTLNGGTLQFNGSNRLVFTSSGGTLDGVTLRGDLNLGDAVNTAGRVRIGSNGLTVLTEAGAAPGVVNVGTVTGASSAILGFTGTQTFDNATLTMGNATQSAIVSLDASGTLTLGAAATIQGSGTLGQAQFVGGTNSLINNGTISANFAGRGLTINNTGTVTNTGLLEARNGASLALSSGGLFTNNGVVEARTGSIVTLGASAWINNGTLRVVDATSVLNLGGSFTLATLGTLQNSAGGTINLTGTLNNAATTFNLTPTTGLVRLVGGTISGGTVQNNGTSRLVFTNSNGTLDGVTFRGDMNIGDLSNTVARVRIGSNGVTVLSETGAAPGAINLGTVAGASGTVLGFTGTQTFDNATITLGNATQSATVSLDNSGTFTLGANAVVQGSGSFGQAQFVGGTGNLINNGTFSANVAGRGLTINNSGTVTNTGLLEARNGASLALSSGGLFTNNGLVEARTGSTVTLGASAWINNGTLRVVDATSVLNLGGSFTLATLGTLQNSAGGTINITGTLNNAATTFNLTPTTGLVRLVGGTISGGTVQNNGTSRLVFTNSNGTLDGVTFRGDMNLGDLSNTVARVRIGSNGLTVLSETGATPGVINLGTVAGASGTVLGFTGTQTFDNATITMGNATQSATVSLDNGGTFTLGASAVVQGSGSFGQAQFVGGTSNLINNGTFSANAAGRGLTINNGGTVVNTGLLEARNGASLALSSGGLFTNNGLVEARTGSTVTLGASAWINNGTLRVVDATSVLNLGGSFTLATLGTLQNSAGGTINITGTLNNAATTFNLTPTTGLVRLAGGTISGGTVQNNGTSRLVFTNSNGTLDGVTFRGDMNLGDLSNTVARVRIGSNGLTVLSETGAAPGVINLGTVAGASGTVLGFTGTQTFDNAIITMGNATQSATISLDNGGTFTLGASAVVQGSGGFGQANFVGGTGNLINNGSVSANAAGRTLTLNNSGTVTNNGTFDARNGATLTIGPTAGFTNFSGTTLTGGSYIVTGASILQFAAANIVTNAADIQLDGSASVLRNTNTSANALVNLASNTSAGRLTIRNGRNFTTAGAFSNAGVVNVGNASTFATTGAFTDAVGSTLQMAGGTFTATSLANAGSVQGFGTVSPLIQNTGVVRANGGTLLASLGVQGTGDITIDTGATLNLSSAVAASTVTTFSDAGSLNLGSQNLVVASDYFNANFGSGNTFNARAGVTGSGLIVGLNAAQTLTGSITSTGANAFVMNFGNVRGGTSSTLTYQVANSGTGASIRGAVQTSGISDTRLSGSGVTAGNFGALAAGAQSGARSVTLTAAGGGALSGQSIVVPSNFGNVATQTLAISGFTSVLAQGLAAPAGPLNLGSFRVGIAPDASTSLSATNTITGPGAERLGLSAATTSGNFAAVNVLGSGFVLPGATAPVAVTVSTFNGVAGINSGSLQLQFTTNGALIDPSFVTAAANQQTVSLSAAGYLVAQPTLPATPVDVGNYRLASGAIRSFAIVNTNLAPAGFEEALNVTAGAVSTDVTLAGTISGLAPGGSSSAMSIGFLSGGAAGPRSGSGALNLVTDGTGSSGLGTLALASQSVQVVGTAYRLATPVVDTTPITLFARVGNTAPSQAITVTNSSPDIYTERLSAAIAAVPSGFTGAGTVTGLAASGSSSALNVTLATGTSGSFGGAANVALVSSGTGTTGAPDQALTSASVNLTGRVYAPAVAQVASSSVNFGIVRVGDAVAGRTLTLSNTASGALTDTLQASLGSSSAPFTSGGSVTGLAAGSSNSTGLTVQLSTANAGVFSSQASLTLASHNPDMTDLALSPVTVTLQGQVNNIAAPALSKASGAGSFSGSGLSYTLDFGSFVGSGSAGSSLVLANAATGTADALAGNWDLSGLFAGVFSVSGFGNFSNLAGGAALSGLSVSFNTDSLGSFDQVVVLRSLSTNGSGPDLALGDVTLRLQGNVVAVPEPGTYALMAGGLLALLLRQARQRRREGAMKKAA